MPGEYTPEQLRTMLAEAERAPRAATPEAPQDPYAPTVWGESEYDFRVPSGQLCRLRKIQVEKLVEEGILDQVSRLPGLANSLVTQAQGERPEAALEDKEQWKMLVDLVNRFVPLAVVKPEIQPMPEDGAAREPGRIYVDDVEIMDRVAILNRALTGVAKLDSFRDAGEAGAGVVDEQSAEPSAV